MDIASLPIKEAVVTPNTQRKAEEFYPLYWFEKQDGSIFSAKEKEAWEIIKGRIKIMNYSVRHRYLGCSTGQLYWEEIKKVPQVLQEQGQEKASEFIRDVEKRECATANPSIRPRNFDGRDLGGNPSTADIGGMRI